MATVKPIDAPMTTYNQATVGATSTALVKAGVTGVTPTNTDLILKAMSKSALKDYIRERVEQGRQLSIELLAALTEMKSRCKDQGTWHKTLLDCGIKPGTWRQWEFRQLNALTTGKRTGDRKSGSGGTRVKTASAKTDRLDDPRLETEAQVVAKAGVQLAKILQDPNLSEAERSAKATDFAGEMITAVEGGDYTVIPVFPAGAKRTRTPEEVAALNWILRLMGAFIADNSKMPQAAEARKHATIMRKIVEEEILGCPTPGGSGSGSGSPSAAPEPEPALEAERAPVWHFDGAAEPNPGRMGWGWTINDEAFCGGGEYGTNNEAEYNGLLALLDALAERGIRGARIEGDSQVVIFQCTGEYVCKSTNLGKLNERAVSLIQDGGHIINWCHREENEQADAASRCALAGLDGRLTTEQLEANKQEDLSLYVERLGDLDPSMSAVKIGKKLKELGLRDENGKPVPESGITIFYHGFWTSFWHIEKCRKALGIDQASAPVPAAPEPAPEPGPTPAAAPVEYIPDFIQDPDEMYNALLSLPWQRHQASFGQPVPRDEVWVATYPYKYSRRIYPAYDGWTPELLSIKEAVEAKTGVKYDSVLCNLYRSGKDYVPYHCDCEDEMSSSHPIASVSFGAERVFQMRLKADWTVREKMKLGNGSLLLMKTGMQQEWEHGVPRTTRNVGERINLTFRVMTKTEGVI